MSKTSTPTWSDLFHTGGTRRDFLRVSAGVAGLVGLGALSGCGGRRRVLFPDRVVPEVEIPGGPVETLADFVVESGRPGVVPA